MNLLDRCLNILRVPGVIMSRVHLVSSVLFLCVFTFTAWSSDRNADRGADAWQHKPSGSTETPYLLSSGTAIQHGLSDGTEPTHLVGRPILSGKARTDTIYILGGDTQPNLGDFQDQAGDPDWDGWYGVDLTVQEYFHWQVAGFNAELLDPTEPDNHAWWCGGNFTSCHPGDPDEGYGNFWIEWLDWYGTVADPSEPVQVRVTGRMNYDTEATYDFLYLQSKTVDGMEDRAVFDGDNRDETGEFVPVDVDIVFSVAPGDFVGDNQDQVHLRWAFESDIYYSDQDCNWPTAGAAQIDLLAVYFDQGAGEVLIGEIETCEPGDPLQWAPETVPGEVGNFAKVWPILNDIDPCRYNTTPQVAFVDDGEVEPCSGGYFCTTWCYGPFGYVVNPEGGCAGPEYHLRNAIFSPVLTWPEGDYPGAILSFDVYRHVEFYTVGMTYEFGVRSTVDPGGETGWTEWRDLGFVYFEPQGFPSYMRWENEITSLLLPGRTYAQIRLGVFEAGWLFPAWGGTGTDAAPGPYFDNVALKTFQYGGPYLDAGGNDLTSDNFPEIGVLDYSDLGTNHVRFDAIYDARDDLRVTAKPVRTGSVLAEHPKMHYKLRPNPLFDPYRISWPQEGYVHGDSVRNSLGFVVENEWSFDLPDTGFLYPGDVLAYCFEAQDDVAGDIGTTLLPADTTDFSQATFDTANAVSLYPSRFVVRALPSVHSTTPGDQPSILLFIHDGLEIGEAEWRLALGNLGFRVGVDCDLFMVGSLGSYATTALLDGYDTIVWQHGTFLEDILLLDSWLMTGGRNFVLTMPRAVTSLYQSGHPFLLGFLNNWLSISWVAEDVGPLIGMQRTPHVRATPDNPIFYQVDEWIAYGACPTMVPFEAVLASGSSERIAEWLGPGGETGGYPYAAGVYNYNAGFDAEVVYLPYEFNQIWTAAGGGKTPTPSATRTQLLDDIFTAFGHAGSSPVTNVPQEQTFTIRNLPNPFNPSTKFEYTMPNKGQLTLKLYNVRGELVRVLLDEVVPAGPGRVIWDGKNDHGQAVASGVYFYQVQVTDRTEVGKLALVK